jgi:hypothetical protein
MKIGAGVDLGADCELDLRKVDPRRADRVGALSTMFSMPYTIGTLPGNGWAHRSVPLGGVFSGRCSVGYEVIGRVGNEWMSIANGKVDVPRGRDRHRRPSRREPAELDFEKGGKVLLSYMVEQSDDVRVLRMLVMNNSWSPIVIGAVDRELDCGWRRDARWDLRDTPLGGEMAGPEEVDAHGWMVFVMPVEEVRSDRSKLDKCEGWVAFESFMVDEDKTRLFRLDFQLLPSGRYGPFLPSDM